MDKHHNLQFEENAANLLKQTVADIEAENKAIDEAKENIKALLAQAKAHGLDTAIIRSVLKQRKDGDDDAIIEGRMLEDLYRDTLGMRRLGELPEYSPPEGSGTPSEDPPEEEPPVDKKPRRKASSKGW